MMIIIIISSFGHPLMTDHSFRLEIYQENNIPNFCGKEMDTIHSQAFKSVPLFKWSKMVGEIQGENSQHLMCQLPALDGIPLILAPAINNLGVLLDASLSIEILFANIARLVFFQFFQVKQLAPFLSSPDMAMQQSP